MLNYIKTFKKYLPAVFLLLFFYFISRMLVMTCYNNSIKDPNDPYLIAKFTEIHNDYIHLRYVKPHGKGILVPFIIEGMRILTRYKVPLITLFRRLDLFFIFVSFLSFYLLLKKMDFDFKSRLIAILALAFYLSYGFVRVFPVWRLFDIPNLMFCILGTYFIFTNLRAAFLINLALMSFNKESGLLLLVILFIYLLLNQEARKNKFKDIKDDSVFFIISAVFYVGIQILLEKIVVYNVAYYNLPWPWSWTAISTMLYYAPKNMSLTGLKYLFTWFNILLILSLVNFFKKSNFSKSLIFGAFFYILSAYMVGGIFGEGEGILLPVIPMLILVSAEELKKLGVFSNDKK